MAIQRQKVIKTDGAIQVVEVFGGGGGSVAWGDITGKPATFPPTIGTTATTAKAGNYAPAWGDVSGKPATFTPPAATTAAIGGVKQGAAVADAAAAPTQSEFNALLASLRAAGVIAS
ncbi:head fiber protein [Serratia rubidaea]|uniref:head fiber protein n=1 Tax=Serratia rubidaea TaxID=61652 RepID=UPI00242EA824|nr:head fiber protein [Serratia rubidaea]MCR0998665.1 head fiber protein [Serratia rubidaea]